MTGNDLNEGSFNEWMVQKRQHFRLQERKKKKMKAWRQSGLQLQISGPANRRLGYKIGGESGHHKSSYLTDLIQISHRSGDFLSRG